MTMIEIYTDGSCDPNPGEGGWAYVIPALGIEKSGYCRNTTNNRMEMQAIIEALRATGSNDVIVHSDSQLCIKTLEGLWKAKKNRDLFLVARELMAGRRVLFKWVRGHSGHQHNERCDVLAGDGRRSRGAT